MRKVKRESEDRGKQAKTAHNYVNTEVALH
jgi:hypothetical protein